MTQYVGFVLSKGQYTEFPCFIEGDDSLVRYPQGIDPTAEFYARYGWNIKMERHLDLCEASFCGLVFDQQELVSVCNIHEALLKFWTNKRYTRSNSKVLMGLLRAKAMSMACEYGNVPLLGELAHRILHLTRSWNVRKSYFNTMDMYERQRHLGYLKEKPWQTPPNVGIQTRQLVQRLYGISVADQYVIEERFKTLELGGFSVPELEFPSPLVHNMTRVFEVMNQPRILNVPRRRRVVDAMLQKVVNIRNSVPPSTFRKMTIQLTNLVDPFSQY